VLERVRLRGDETVVDVGCGTGRLTAELAGRVPRGRVLAVDASASMLEEARRQLARFGSRVEFLHRDVLALDLDRVAGLVFSTATLHWVLDHEKLFRVLYRALKPGGRLEAQCGGGPNIALLTSHADAVARGPRFAGYFRSFRPSWYFATPEETAARMTAAGFADVHTALEAAPTPFESADAFREFVAKVPLRPYLDALPEEPLRAAFMDEIVRRAAADDPPYTIDYWRLNMRARKPKA